MIELGTMVGRLSEKIDNKIQAFPTKSWRKEFEIARKSNFDVIEWILDTNENPIMNEDGIHEIHTLSKKFDIKINSICCDNFMEKPLFKSSKFDLEKNLKILEYLINTCQRLEIKYLEIPLVDSASIKSKNEEQEFIQNLQNILPLLEKNNVYLTLESDFEPLKFKEFLLKFNDPNVVANYDTGNSASLGYNPEEELTIMGELIKNIHIKDRKRGGSTVELGKGDADFEKIFQTLSKISYSGDLILQGARLDNTLSPEETCVRYKKFVKQYVDKY
jgi:L-ribulose-5-phosphate 3-epimerase